MSEDSVEKSSASKKKTRVTQTSFPLFSIDEALRIAKAIKDSYAGQPTAPLLVADACNISPTSSNWRYLAGASVAYGLTDGGYNAKEISLTSLGERIVSPIKEGDDAAALVEAVTTPTILGKLYKQYNGNKIPRTDILKNVLQREGVPPERLDMSVEIFKTNAQSTNILRTISGNEYIHLDTSPSTSSLQQSSVQTNQNSNDDIITDDDEQIPVELLKKINVQAPTAPELNQHKIPRDNPHVFISHGKNNKTIVGQLKELLSYGQMTPIVSVDRETTAIPVPDKVFDDMRDCDAGIIHVDTEEIVGDNGNSFNCLNENVLIEIGAAIALYGKKVILLCKKGTKLPSNLQGLYRCEYEGNQLDYASTMKILKTLQELRGLMV